VLKFEIVRKFEYRYVLWWPVVSQNKAEELFALHLNVGEIVRLSPLNVATTRERAYISLITINNSPCAILPVSLEGPVITFFDAIFS
jgi:hypothetical protein